MAAKADAKCASCGAEKAPYAAINHIQMAGAKGSDHVPDGFVAAHDLAVCGKCFTRDYKEKFGVKPEGVVEA